MIECYIRLRVNSIQNYYHQINLFMILYHISLRYNIKSFRRMIYISQSVINVDYIYYISVMIEFESVAYYIHCVILYGVISIHYCYTILSLTSYGTLR
jgi:hypothetical protein